MSALEAAILAQVSQLIATKGVDLGAPYKGVYSPPSAYASGDVVVAAEGKYYKAKAALTANTHTSLDDVQYITTYTRSGSFTNSYTIPAGSLQEGDLLVMAVACGNPVNNMTEVGYHYANGDNRLGTHVVTAADVVSGVTITAANIGVVIARLYRNAVYNANRAVAGGTNFTAGGSTGVTSIKHTEAFLILNSGSTTNVVLSTSTPTLTNLHNTGGVVGGDRQGLTTNSNQFHAQSFTYSSIGTASVFQVALSPKFIYPDTSDWDEMGLLGAIVNAPSSPPIEYITSSQTWVCPSYARKVQVTLVGGGGGGGSSQNSSFASGGGSGGQVLRQIVAVTPGTGYPIVIGAGGAGGTVGGSGAAGGNTTGFGFTASGGPGGSGDGKNSGALHNGGSGASYYNNYITGGVGGVGGAGRFGFGGGGGGGGCSQAYYAGAPGPGGGTGLNYGQPAANGAAQANTGGGGGGGGAYAGSYINGGAGASGIVIIEVVA